MDFQATVDELGDPQQLDPVSHLVCALQVVQGKLFNSGAGDRLPGNLCSVGELDQDSEFLSCVGAIHVKCWICLGITSLLCLCQCLFVSNPRLGHPGHDVIAGAIEDATEGLNPVRRQALADGCDNRDSPTHRCLEGNRPAQLPRSFK